MDGNWMDGWVDGKAGLRIAYSNKKALHAITLIRNFFSKDELLKIVTSNYFSILYYNAEIWQIPSLCKNSKKNLLTASGCPTEIMHKKL